MSSKKIFHVEKNTDDIRITVLTNVVKMLTERNLLKKDSLKKNIEKLTTIVSDEMVYTITDVNKNKIAVKILPQKITAVNKATGILDFLNNFKDNKKIIIIKEISKKAHQFILNNYSNTEIFLEEELMINIIDHILVPQHILLSNDEAKYVLEKYNAKKKDMPKIYSTDPIARYYDMKPGNICRIIRPSETAGFSPSYRLVIKGSIK